MKLFTTMVIYFCFSLLIIGCKKDLSPVESIINFSLLDGNSFIYKINRIVEMPDVQFPTDDLQEDDYTYISDGTQYTVIFSSKRQTVNIEPGSMSGQMTIDRDESKFYEFDTNVFSGGRFVVWINNNNFEAELTIYGSGIPIIKSERGCLTQK